MSLITIKSRLRDYDVHFEDSQAYLSAAQKSCADYCLIIDAKVWELYKRTLLKKCARSKCIILPISEERKSLTTVGELYDALIERTAKRNMTIISLGGGIVQDITGFLASTLYRGVQWIFLPTTFLAQADSCIGSKTSLNYKHYKNLIGTFYPPVKICVDTTFLQTQKEVDFYSGLGEVVKLHIMGGEKRIKELLTLLPKLKVKDGKALKAAVHNSLLIKQSYIEEDEFDAGRRNLLNYGHCFGHALETTANFAVPHGQAVVAGMVIANIVSRNRGLLECSLEKYVRQRLLMPALKAKLKKRFFASDEVIAAMKKDKKRTGEGLALVMLADNYKMIKVTDVTTQEAEIALKEFTNLSLSKSLFS